eukprot:COSAG01_NODE_13879_length_1523_cov_1.810393_1_plen_431_part_01
MSATTTPNPLVQGVTFDVERQRHVELGQPRQPRAAGHYWDTGHVHGVVEDHWSMLRVARAIVQYTLPAPPDVELLHHLQQQVESLHDLQARLPHAATLARAGGKHSAACKAMLKDLGEAIELARETFLAATEHQGGALDEIIPVSAAKQQGQVRLSHVTDTCMEVFNEVGDILLALDMWNHRGVETGVHEARWLFWVSVGFLALTTVVRLAIARLMFWPRVRDGQGMAFLFAVLIYVVEPAYGQIRLKRTLMQNEKGGTIWDEAKHAYVKVEVDVVAVRARNEYVAGEAQVRTVLALVASEDIPGFLIQLIFLLLYSTGITYAWYVSTVGTVLHIARQSVGALSTQRRLSALQRMADARDYTFNSSESANDIEVEQFAKEYGSEVRIVSLGRNFRQSSDDGFGDKAVLSLARHCPYLRGVNLNLCKTVADE